MPVLRDTVIPLNNYAAGTYQTPSLNLQSWAAALRFEVRRCTSADPTIWPSAATSVTARVEFSPDNGATWQYLGGMGATGGIYMMRDGSEAPASVYCVTLPGVGNNQRRLRGEIIVAGGTVRTEAIADVQG